MPEQGQQRDDREQRSTFQRAIQAIGVFMLIQFLMNQFLGQKNTGSNVQPSGIPPFAERLARGEINNYNPVPDGIAPIWPPDSAVDISIYVSPYVVLPRLDLLPEETLVLDEKNFRIGNYSDSREVDTTIRIPREVQRNGTLWAHFYVALTGHQLDPSAKDYTTETAVHFLRPLNHYLPKRKAKKLKNLLSSQEEVEEVEDDTPNVQIASYYHPNFTVSFIPDFGTQSYQRMHPAVRQHVQLEATGARDATGQNGWYYPIVFLNTFWQLKSHMRELNSTVESVPLRITLNNLVNWKFNLIASIDEGNKRNSQQAAFGGSVPGSGDGSEFEMVKEILLDTNIWLLGTTGFVSILHMIFETLAFKNDIAHWRKKKDVIGTSVRTILANVFMQVVVFLYLMDNSENTSWMILGTQGFGIILEAWKITKTVDVRLRPPQANSYFSFLPYVIVFEDKHKLSDIEKKTQEYDEIAFKYLYIAAVPLLGAYAMYSLIYETHKSWYSYIIETLVGSVYAYGFLMMVPSLYINYRLKSVAHMPGKALMYKFLNTFIDDLFAFTVKMPWLHRLSTFRDDIIFFIWLYQSWKYKVDYKRVNEFGQGGEDDEAVDEEVSSIEAKKLESLAKATTPDKATKSDARKRK